MTAAVNGSKPPTPRYVVRCPACGETRALPQRPPSVWGFVCKACGTSIEINLSNWKRDE